MSLTWTLSCARPTLNASSWTRSRGASSMARKARLMSSMCTSGRHGVPSLSSRTCPVVIATAVRLFTSMSRRSRGEAPYAVALRR